MKMVQQGRRWRGLFYLDEEEERNYKPNRQYSNEEERDYQPNRQYSEEEERDYQPNPQYFADEQQPGEINYSRAKTKPHMRTEDKSSVLSKKNIEDKGHTEKSEIHCSQTKPQRIKFKNQTHKLLSINRLVSVDDPDNQNDKKESQKTKKKRKRVEKMNSRRNFKNRNEKAQKIGKRGSGSRQAAKKFGFKIECFITRLEAAAEEDAELNRNGEPAVTKLLMLREMRGVLSKKPAHTEFIQRGGLSALKTWLEPLPSKCLPHVGIRSALLKVVDSLNLDIADLSVKEKPMESR